MKKYTKIQENIISSLYLKKYIGKRHTPIENLCKRLSQYPCKIIKKELKTLRNEGLLSFKQTYHGKDIYLNPKKIKEIEEIVNKYNDWI